MRAFIIPGVQIPSSPLVYCGDDMCQIYYVYVLKSLKHDFHYIGHTFDLKTRLETHNRKKVRSTKGHAPFELIYFEMFSSRPEACKREMHLKQADGNIWLRNHLKENKLW